ncbi:MAG: alpha-amylase family protein [Actinomycetales bacterium]|nr:alpha-amylase family protein [Actinomycetales bacterium]
MSTATPRTVLDAAARVLRELSPERREAFELRLERWWDDLFDALERIYGQGAAPVATRLVELAAEAYGDRDPELHRLDQRRILDPHWLQSPRMFGYAAYADRFAGTLAEVGRRVDYLQELGVTYLHLMPLLRPRDGDNDGGYAVASYREVRPDLGTFDDLTALSRLLREKGISLVLDLVLNHVAREHEWAQRARAGESRYRDYFYIYPDRTEPDAFEATLPEVFPDFAPENFTWDDEVGGWVWTTFNEWQWDVNWTNPDVLCEYADIVFHLANAGVEVMRLDAIAFTWKRVGTNCQNQPEVHALTQALRAIARIACPAVAFKAEAIVGPRDLVQYLGDGEHAGKVSDLAYHNSLMVQTWSMLATHDVGLTAHALGALPPVPPSATWITYLRCHDDIGWAIDDGDAAAVGLNGFAHRAFLSDWFVGAFPGSGARGLTFQANEATGDRRISGTGAALAGLDAAREAGDAGAVSRAVARIILGHAIISGFGGVPVVWSGDELGVANDPNWAEETGHEDDNRWVHRGRMDWEVAARRHTAGSTEERAFRGLAHLAATRASLPHLDASVPSVVLGVWDPGVLVLARRHPTGTMLCAYNVTDSWRPLPGWVLRQQGLADATEALHGTRVRLENDDNAWLPPYAAWWLVDRVPTHA